MGASCFVRGPPDKGLLDFSLGQVSFPRGQSSQLLGEPRHGWDFLWADSMTWHLTSALSLPVSQQAEAGCSKLVVWDRRRLGDSPSVFVVSDMFHTPTSEVPLAPELPNQPDSCRVLSLGAVLQLSLLL